MKAFTNANARNVQQAVTLAQQAHRSGRSASFAGGGSDLLNLAKERLISPDVIVSLRQIGDMNRIRTGAIGISESLQSKGNVEIRATTIGGLTTLDAVSRDASIRRDYQVLAEAAESVATPQIRNVATIAGNVCQRPWCWYFRNGFPCLKNGGTTCFSYNGENQFHAIFGGGPSYIVHPSDAAVALQALDAIFHVVGPAGERRVAAGDFFALPRIDPARENVLGNEDVLASISIPSAHTGMRSTYQKIMDREAWTHAVVSAAVVLEMENGVCRNARVALGGVAPIPWRLPEVEKMLAGQRITPELAARAGGQAVVGARPLEKNAYKVPLTKALVKRTVLELANRS